MWTNPAVPHPCRLLVSLLFVILLFPQETNAQKRVEGTAVVQVEDKEYTVPIECDDASRPELGFSMEPSRITRERTGRASMINVCIRPFGEEDEVIVSLDRYSMATTAGLGRRHPETYTGHESDGCFAGRAPETADT